jgi:hypothetical protein
MSDFQDELEPYIAEAMKDPLFAQAFRRAEHRLDRRLRIYLEPRDIWVGVYVAPQAVYVCPIPCLVFRWARAWHD